MAKKTKKSVEQQVRDLEKRIANHEPVARFITRVQLDKLAKAEELRKLVLAVLRSQWQHRCSDNIGGCTAVSDSRLCDLQEFVGGLVCFHIPQKKMPPFVRKIAQEIKKKEEKRRGA